MIDIIAALVLTLLVAFAIGRWRPEQARRLHQTIEQWRKILGIIVGILLVATFIQSGQPLLIAFALVIVVLTGLYLAVDQPHKQTI